MNRIKKVGTYWFPEQDAHISDVLRNEGNWQIERLAEAVRHVKERVVAIDGGAHVGTWTRPMIQEFGFQHVLAFEACNEMFECLKRNLWPEEVAGQAFLFNQALGDRETTVGVRYDKRRERAGNTGSRYVQEDEEGGVSMIKIDDLGLERLDLLKLDIEGAECATLRGAYNTIQEYKPVVFVEVKDGMAERFGDEPKCALSMLKDMGATQVAKFTNDYIFSF